MKREFTQKELYELLGANSLGVEVWIGDLEDLQGKDYIFLDYLYDIRHGYDDKASFQNVVQITVCCKDYENRKILVDYIKSLFYATPTYSMSSQYDYYTAQFTLGLFIYE